MADIQANIGINLDTSRALAQLKNLQRQISVFNAEIARGGGKAAAAAAGMQQELVNSINATGQFSASMTTVRSTTESFTNALEKNKLSLGQTFRYAGAASKKFSHLFTGEFNTIEKVARERVKTIQTQYIKMGRDANGAIRSIAVRPLSLDMNNLATQTAMAAQKQQILNQLLRQGSTNLLNWGKNTQWAGRQLMVGFTLPLALFGAAASKSFMELEEQAIRFKRVYGDLFTTPQQADQAFADMQRLGQEFTKYGVAVEKTIGLAASVAQMGKTGAELTAQVTEATRLAVLGGMEQEDALNTTISLTNAFGVAAEDLTGKINFLNAAENQTILSIQDFNEAVPRAGSVVAQLGGDVEDLAFFLTAMREGGIEASQGANALKTSLGRLVNPTKRAREELMAYGIDVVGIVESNAGNLRQTVLDLGMALEQLDPLEKSRAVERLFGKFQFARMSALFNNIMDDGSQAAAVLDLINTSAGDLATIAGRELGRVEESAATKFRSAVEQFQAALAPIGESFLKLVTPIIEFGTRVLNAFNNLNDGTKAFVVGLVATVGAVGPVLLMSIGLLANGIANIMKMFLGLQTVFQKIAGGTKGVGDQTEYMSQQQLEAAAAAASLNQSHSTLQQTFTSELAAVNNLVAAYQRMTTAQRNSLGIPQAVSTTASAPGFAKGRKVPGYKDGVVMVPGPKGAGDVQPAMLAPGEAVIPAAMAEKYGPLINAMIAGNIPGYMAGKTKSTSESVKTVASHFSQETPPLLANVFKDLATSGRRLEKTIFLITKNADGFGYTIEKVRGYVDEFAEPGDTVIAGGRAYGATAVPESDSRNRLLYEDKDIGPKLQESGVAGSWQTTEELSKQAEILAEEKRKNTEAYQRNRSSIEEILLENEKAQQLINQSASKEQAALSIQKEKAKAALTNSIQQENKNISADEAERLATEMLEDIQEQYVQRISLGMSAEDSLREATLDLQRLRLAQGDSVVIGKPGVSSDVVRGIGSSRGKVRDSVYLAREKKGMSTAASDIFTRKFSGQGSPSGGRSAQQILDANKAIDPSYSVSAKNILAKAEKDLALQISKQSKSSSPSKVTEQAAKNLVDGAVKAINEGQDDMQQAGSQLAQATEQGFNNFPAPEATPGTRGGRGRVRTAGEFTTPGQPLAFDIAGGQEVREVQQQFSTLGQRVTEAGTKLSSMSMKLGSAGIAVSSLVGGLSMVDGPLGDFAAKLFPVTSALTALSFATQMLNEQTLKGIGDRVDEAVAAGMKAKADARAAVASNAAATADTREAIASNAAAAADTREAAASTLSALAGSRIAIVFNRVISVAKVMFAGIGTLLGRVGLVIAGLALVAGGLFLLNKIYKDQQEKINGLGDAAKLSGDKLKTLNDILGAELAERQIGGVGGTGAEGTGARTGDEETQQSAQDVQAQLLESEEFEKEFSSVISSLEGASIAAAEQALTSMAFTLQTAGASEEMIAGIVNALLVAAGKTDIVLDFSSITLGTAQQSAADAANQYAESFSTAVKNISDEDIVARASATAASGAELYIGDIGGGEAEAERQLASGALSSLILDANEQLRQGLIDITEYNAAIATVGDTIGGIADTDPKGLAAASLLVAQMAQDMEAAGFEGAAEDVQSFLDLNTAAGLTAATTVMSARASGTEISEGEMGALTAGAREGATSQDVVNSEIAIASINSRTAATIRLAEAEKELSDARETTAAFETEIEKQNAAIQGQIDTYNDVSDAIAGNTEIQDKNAFAQKIAADETLRNAWAAAQLQDAEAGNTEATQNFIAAMQEQSAMQDQLNAQSALADIENSITQKQRETNVTDALGIALGDSAEAQAIMNNAQVASYVLSQLAAEGFDTAGASAEELAAKIKESGILEVIAAASAADLIPKVTTSGGGGTPKSFLDDIVKGLRDVASGQTTVTNGFKSSLRALVAFSKSGIKGLNGLSSQLRKAGVTGTFAEKILGMDPKDWEKQKRELFNFDAAGNITGLTAAGEAVQEALGVIEIGKFIDEQQNLTVSVGEQIEALNRLTGAGASYEAAYAAVQNAAFASAVATAKSTELITAAAQEAMTAMAKMKELEEINEEEERRKRISEAIREQNKEFSNQAKILDHINKSNYSEAQINEILNNKDLQSLVLEPSIDPGALSTALANAQKQADLELRIKKLTVEGQEDIFQEGVSNAMSAFGALEEEIDIEFRATIKDDDSLIQDAERQIALIDFELDDYQAGLDEIDRLEQDINDVYDKRIEALDEVATLNEDIARSQESQLEIADALSKGDIAAAARAAQQSRQVQQESAREAQQRMLEEQRSSEIARLRSSSGMTREDLQDRIRDLEEQIFNIEEKTLEPAQERIRLAEITRDDRVADLQVLGKTREEWDKISNSVDVAQANGWRFADAMQEALNIVEKLVDNLVNRPLPPPPAPAPAPQSSGGGGGGDPFPSKDQWKLANNQPLSSIVPPGQSWQEYYNANRDKLDNQLTPPAQLAYGGIVSRARSAPPQQYFGGGKVKGPGTEKSDSIPAMLSNGEYVIRASSVRLLGKDFLDKLNGGKVVPDEKNGLPAFRTGGFVNTGTLAGILKASQPKPPPKKYTPPVSIRQAERAASKPAPTPKPSLPPSRTVAAPAPVTRRPSSASASRTTAPAPAPRPAPAPAVVTQDTRTPLAKALDGITNTMRQSGMSNYLPDPKKAIRDAVDFFMPFTSESMKESDDGLPTASGVLADVALFGAGSLIGRLAQPVIGAISKAVRVPTVAVPGATAAATSTATRTSSRSIMDVIRQETQNVAAGTRFIGSRPAPFGKPVNFDDTKLNFEANFQTKKAANIEQSKQIEDYVVEYARQNNKTIVEAITDANDSKLINNVFPEDFNTYGDQVYLINQIDELEALLAKPPVETQAIEKILPAQGYLDSKILAPFRAMDRLFASRARTQSSGFSQLGNSRIYQGAVGLLPPNLRAMALTATARHRSASSILGDPGNLLNPRNVPVASGRVFGPGTYLAQTPKLSDELFGNFGDNAYRVGMSPTVLKRLFSSKGYITPTELRKRGLHIGDETSIDHPTIRTLMNEGYVGYQHGDALTNWLIGGDSAFKLVPTTAKAIADSGASLRSRLNAVQQYMKFFENARSQQKLLSGNPATSIPRISLPYRPKPVSPSARTSPRQSSTFLDKESLKDIDIPLDTEFHAGVYTKQSSFVEDLSGNKYFVKEHLGTYLDDPGSIKSSFSNEFLAGRVGNQIGANTPQSYIIRRGPNYVPFEIATRSIPSSMGMAPEKMQRLIQSSPDPIKTLEDLLEAYAKYNKATPALNAVFHNTDLHRNNVMWDNLNKRLMQIDFGQSAPYSLRNPEGSAAALQGREHYKLPEAIQSSTQSMATVRAAINDAINEAIDLGFLNRPAQLELAQRARSLGFGVSPNTNDINPLKDVFKTAHVSTDLTDAYTKIANLDMKDLPSQVAKDLGAKTTFLHDITELKIDQIKDRALVLLNTGRAARINIGEADKEGVFFSRQLRMDSNKSSFYRMGGIVKSINSDNVPAMLTAGEYVVKRSAVQSFGADNLEKINNGTYNNGSVYNYNLEVNVKSDADPNKIARTVITNIKGIENQRVRGNKL